MLYESTQLTFTTDSIVSKCESGQKAVTRNAYLLFYRRRNPHPLGPPSLQQIIQPSSDNEENPDSDAEDEDRARPRTSILDSGNGQRLDASSRNGSSSAYTPGTAVAAGVAAQRAAGSHPPLGRASLLKNARGVEDLNNDAEDEFLPAYDGANDDDDDEGFVDADDVRNVYAPLERYGGGVGHDEPVWSFSGIGGQGAGRGLGDDSDDGASDRPFQGSGGGEALSDRLMQDFGDEDGLPGSPVEMEEVHEIRVVGE